jgi:hypothetical protein
VTIRPVNNGHGRGNNGSRVALSVCDGLSGYIKTNQWQYFELMKGQELQVDGKLLYFFYKVSEASAGGGGALALVAGRGLAQTSEVEVLMKPGRTRRPKDRCDANYREQTLVS